MPSKVDGVSWGEGGRLGVGKEEEEEDAASWTRGEEEGGREGRGGGLGLGEGNGEVGLPGFKPVLEEDWYAAPSAGSSTHGDTSGHPSPHRGLEPLHAHDQEEAEDVGFSAHPSPADSMLLQPVDSSASCSPSSVFNLDTALPFFTQRSAISSLFNGVCSNPFDAAATAFDLDCDCQGFLSATQMGTSAAAAAFLNGGGDLGGIFGFAGGLNHPTAQFQPTHLLPLQENGGAAGFGYPWGFGVFDGSPFFPRSKLLQPLEIFPPVGAQPTLFQKRAAALRGAGGGGMGAFLAQDRVVGEKRKRWDEEAMGDAGIDCSDLNYDSDEAEIENARVEDGGNTSNANSTVTCGGGGGEIHKGKKKGLPAKNLMAERRRRKKLNDRLYMLRSVVPKISKVREEPL
uniref:Transcription factor ICE1 n=1 Tax=Anthurium amnicola TaxID=1678845 RepID=A0A1D1ZFM1_9ARAE